MTKELLNKANALNKRIMLVKELIDSAKDMPITIQSGMGQVVQFDVYDDVTTIDEVKNLDNELHKRLIELLEAYAQQLDKQFIMLGED